MKKVGKPDSLFATLMGISAGYYVWHQQLTILDGIFSHLIWFMVNNSVTTVLFTMNKSVTTTYYQKCCYIAYM